MRECAKLDIEEEQRLAEIGEYWDTHSLADHWDETSEVEFEVTAARRHRIALEPEIYERIEVEAELRGVVPEKLANSILKERLGELASR
ncbi:MAG: hypothetical protein ACRD6X_12085 [Pyrinomonadaceae bacterium]